MTEPEPATSDPIRLPGWARLLPSAGDVVLIALLSLMLRLPPYDTDLWWHLRTGDWILSNESVPSVDVFSFTALGRPWIAHEWLSEIGLALLWGGTGIEGVTVVQAIVLTLVLAILYRHLSADGATGPVAIPLILCVTLLLMPSAHPRPYLLTLVGLALLQLMLRRAPRRRTYVLVPLLFLAWANVHAGFALGVAWLGLVSVGELWATRRVPWQHLALVALAVTAAMVNPNGIELLFYPFEYGTGSTLYRFVVEWASPDFHLVFNWLVAAYLLVALLAVFVVRPRGWRRGVVVALPFGLLALMSVRNIPVLAVLTAPYIGLAATALLPARLKPDPSEPLLPSFAAPTLLRRLGQKLRAVLVFDSRHHTLWWLAVVVLLVSASVWVAPHAPDNWDPAASPRTSGQDFPYAAVATMREAPLEGNLLNDDGWGGYLIWSLYPDRPVFIDGRFDVYGEEITTDYVSMIGMAPGWQDRLDAYDIHHVLLRPHVPLAQTLRYACDWNVRHEDRYSVLMSRPDAGICP